MSERVKVAVIGVGMGKHHAECYQRCPQAELAALCDRDAARLAEVAGILGVERTFTDTEELFRMPGLQAVSVALPNFLHAPVTIAALNAGLHVLCEKPLALNAVEAEEMVATARRAGKRLMVHFNTRFNETSLLVKQAVEAGELGEIYFARTMWHRNRGVPGLGGWFTQKRLSGGGALIDIGVHRLDLALWLMGFPPIRSVSGTTYGHLGQQIAQRQGKSFDVDDLAAGFIRFENGASMTFEISWASQAEKREDMCTHLMGTHGGAIIRNLHEGYQMEARLLKDVGGALVEASPMTHLPGMESAQAHFVRCILENRETLAPGEQGLTVMRVLDAIYESARTGREVLLNGR
jgi:predicted dehydrogenase